MKNELPKRKLLRLKNFDYSRPGAYFITVCTQNRRKVLSDIVGAIHESPETKLTEYGKIVEEGAKNALYFNPKEEYTKALLTSAGIDWE